MIYLVGSLRNERVPLIGNILREAGFDVFDDWHGAGPTADDEWQRYEQTRGRSYEQALAGYAAENTFNFDLRNITRATAGVLVTPAGRSAHLELGYLIGSGKPGYVLFDTPPERWDVMYLFARSVHFSVETLLAQLHREPWTV